MKPIEVFDGITKKRLAYLGNAYDISFIKKTGTLWSGSFKLPYEDFKKNYCKVFNLVKLWETDVHGSDIPVGLFRILPNKQHPFDSVGYVEYKIEHVLGTLLDDVMEGWKEIGNADVSTSSVIAYILSHQTDIRWAFQKSDYEFSFLYGWQDENLLSALLSITKPFLTNDYMWKFDTDSFPWRISLVRASATPVADIRYKKNITSLTRTEDPTNVVTILYCYGYGQADNKLNIESVNNGKRYLTSPNVAKYGSITEYWTDERYTTARALKEAGDALLSKIDKPKITYEYAMASYEGHQLSLGETVRIVNDDLDELTVVQSYSKGDVSGEPLSADVTFGSGTVDITNSTADIIQRQRINETYSQGAESLFMDSMSDNADYNNPLTLTFIIPSTVVHVNEILFNAKLTRFRAYSKAAKGGGGVVDIDSGEQPGHVHDIDIHSIPWANTAFYRPLYIHKNDGDIKAVSDTLISGFNNHTMQNKAKHIHKINLDPHGHELQYGIYQGLPAATYMEIYVDGVYVGVYGSTVSDLDIISYLNKDSDGKVTRGSHTIEMKPYSLSRIEASFMIRLFTNSTGGSQY